MAGRRRSRGHAAIYSAVELELVLLPPLELRPAGLPAAPRSAIGRSLLVPAVLECCHPIQDPSAPVSSERLSDDDSSQKQKKKRARSRAYKY